MEKILYLPIETIARELDAKLLLAHRALSRGYSIIIGQKNNVFRAAECLGYGIYLYKSHERSSFPKSHNLNESDFIYVALDEEGLTFLNDKSYIERAIPNELEHLRIVFTWGQYQRNLLVKENPGLEYKTIPVGNPRFDLLRPEFAPLYTPTIKKLLSTWGRYILVNTNFGPGNFSRHYGCNYLEHCEHLCVISKGRTLSEHERYFYLKEEKYYKDLFNQYQEMIIMLSSKFPDINFIWRPHPSEDHKNLKEILKGLQNVHIIFRGSAVDWIQGALAVIHTGSTTGIESWALRKPVIVYNTNPNYSIEPELPNKLGLYVKNINKIYKVLEDIISGKFKNTFNGQTETAHLFIGSIKGKMSAERIMDALDSLSDNQQNDRKNAEKSIYIKLRGMESIKRASKFRILKLIRKHRRAIRILAGKRMDDYIFSKFKKYPGIISQFQKFPGLSSNYIRRRLSVFDLIFKKKCSKNYSVRKFATDTYIIAKR